MNKKTKIIGSLVIIIIVSFLFGMYYGKSSRKFSPNNSFGERVGQSNMMNKVGGQRNGNNFINGEILSLAENSLTIKLMEGGSKIIFFSTSTEVQKMETANLSELTAGKQISITGTTNSNGSIIAKSIQIRTEIKQNLERR